MEAAHYAHFYSSSTFSDLDIVIRAPSPGDDAARAAKRARRGEAHGVQAAEGPAEAGGGARKDETMPGHRVVLCASPLAAQLKRWQGEVRPRVVLQPPDGFDDGAYEGDAEPHAVLRAFVSCLYKGVGGALGDEAPGLLLALLRTAQFYQTEAVATAAALLLAKQFRYATPSTPWLKLVPAARGVLALYELQGDPSNELWRLMMSAASYLASHMGYVQSEWLPGPPSERHVLSEPSAAVVAAVLRDRVAIGRLHPNSAFLIAADWCAAQPGGGDGEQRRTVLTAVPLRALSNGFFLTSVLGSPMGDTIKPHELQALLVMRHADREGLDDIAPFDGGIGPQIALPAEWCCKVHDDFELRPWFQLRMTGVFLYDAIVAALERAAESEDKCAIAALDDTASLASYSVAGCSLALGLSVEFDDVVGDFRLFPILRLQQSVPTRENVCVRPAVHVHVRLWCDRPAHRIDVRVRAKFGADTHIGVSIPDMHFEEHLVRGHLERGGMLQQLPGAGITLEAILTEDGT